MTAGRVTAGRVTAGSVTAGLVTGALRTVHLLSLVVFLGSVVTFVMISELVPTGKLADLAVARTIIREGSYRLIVPGMWILMLSGAALMLRAKRLRDRSIWIKLGLGALVVSNAHLFVLGNVDEATSLALASKQAGVLDERYAGAYLRESAFGALNVVLVLAALVVTELRHARLMGPSAALPRRP